MLELSDIYMFRWNDAQLLILMADQKKRCEIRSRRKIRLIRSSEMSNNQIEIDLNQLRV